jgi:hypothetical protein
VLFSPQTYHTLYGGHSAVFSDCVERFIYLMEVTVPIDRADSNVPMIYGCSVSLQELSKVGPHIQSALPQYERMVDCLGTWGSKAFQAWNVMTASTKVVEDEYDHYCCPTNFGLPGVGTSDNKNLSASEKELLLWH